jgi:hypothetical protein
MEEHNNAQSKLELDEGGTSKEPTSQLIAGSLKLPGGTAINRIPFQNSHNGSETKPMGEVVVDEEELHSKSLNNISTNSLTTPTPSIKPGAPQRARRTFRNLRDFDNSEKVKK